MADQIIERGEYPNVEWLNVELIQNVECDWT
jgi:hypothetical protein